MVSEKTDPFSITFKNTASVEDIIIVLNSLGMVTENLELVNAIKDNDNIILKEIKSNEQTK